MRRSDTDHPGGCIINISSALAHRGGSGSTIYAASKAGVIGFTKALAEEVGSRNIRCNAIAPGLIETDMVSGRHYCGVLFPRQLADVEGMTEQLRKATTDRTGIRRIGTVDEVAHAAVFLAENDFANGTTVTLDGGLTYQ